jgi:hypothetical protein
MGREMPQVGPTASVLGESLDTRRIASSWRDLIVAYYINGLIEIGGFKHTILHNYF